MRNIGGAHSSTRKYGERSNSKRSKLVTCEPGKARRDIARGRLHLSSLYSVLTTVAQTLQRTESGFWDLQFVDLRLLIGVFLKIESN